MRGAMLAFRKHAHASVSMAREKLDTGAGQDKPPCQHCFPPSVSLGRGH
jgi:hypothetical protein